MDLSVAAQAVLRGAHLIALLSLFGTLVFLAAVAPAALAEAGAAGPPARRRLLRIARLSAALALVIGIAWLVLEAAIIAGAENAASALHALPTVALDTQFGRFVLLRLALLVAVLPLVGARRLGLAAAIALAGIALAVQALIGHAGAAGGRLGATLIGSESIHLLAAGAWLGGLLPLLVVIRLLPQPAAAIACRRFTAIGLPAVLAIAGTALIQVTDLVGGLPGLLGTRYGDVALLKLALFLLLISLAVVNRLVLTERLASAPPDGARRLIRLSLAAEILLGALVVGAAALLASFIPGIHESPVWPLPWRPSLGALADPASRRELILALIAGAGALVVTIRALIRRSWRWPLLMVAGALLALATPRLKLLFIPAYPTSFLPSPTEFADSAIVRGAQLFQASCAVCHGEEGHGNGPAAGGLRVKPTDLTEAHLWAHSDGDLFWFLSHGITKPKAGLVMPGFAQRLSSDARWQLVDYLRALKAGESMRRSGRWSHPIPLPQFGVQCADRRIIDLDDLRGRILRIVALSGEDELPPLPPAGIAVTTIVLTRDAAAKPDGTACVARDRATWGAFAILLGVPPDALPGMQVLADRNGWLRARWRPGELTDMESFSAEVSDVAAHPLPIGAGSAQGHRH